MIAVSEIRSNFAGNLNSLRKTVEIEKGYRNSSVESYADEGCVSIFLHEGVSVNSAIL